MRRMIVTSVLALSVAAAAYAETHESETYLDSSYYSVQKLILPKEKWKRIDVASVPKFGGYIIGSYKYNSQQGANGGEGFDLRLVRVHVDGTVMKDFKYRLQVELNGKPHIKDATLAWSHWQELEVKVGQFKRCFTFENPYHPFDVGMGDYSQLTKKFAGFGDRVGEATMGGRDIGVQVQGDAIKSPRDGHRQLHYALAVFNGQGINTRDVNRRKDFMGTIQWSPIRDLWIGAFGWSGGWTSENGITVDRRRIELNNPIKVAGEHPVVISIYRDIKATIIVVVNAEGTLETDEATEEAETEDVEAIEAIEEAIDIAETLDEVEIDIVEE